MLSLVRLEPARYGKRFPNELSGGEQQRVGVARALAAKPRLLLMDEPFGAVDAIVRAELQDETLRIHRMLGTTILFVTHDVDEAVPSRDRIVVLKDGRIEQVDTPLRVLAAPATAYVANLLDSKDAVRRLQLLALATPRVRRQRSQRPTRPASRRPAANVARSPLRSCSTGASRRRRPASGVSGVALVRRRPGRAHARTALTRGLSARAPGKPSRGGCSSTSNWSARRSWPPAHRALPLGVIVARKRRAGGAIWQLLNIIYTHPEFGAFRLSHPAARNRDVDGAGRARLYAQMVLVRNVAVGLSGVSPALSTPRADSACHPSQVFWRVEFPQALPVIVGGVRLASIALISLATLASWIDAGGLGALVLYGLQHDDPSRAVAGALAAAFLAIVVDVALRALQGRWSRGMTEAAR